MYIVAVSILSPVQLVGQEGVLERNLSTLRFREAKIICLKQFRFVPKFCCAGGTEEERKTGKLERRKLQTERDTYMKRR